MKNSASISRIIAGIALAACVVPLLSACGNKEEPAPGNYYTGPKNSKGVPDDSKTPVKPPDAGQAKPGAP